MHSTIQTGLFTPKIFNYDYNFHRPNSSVSHMHQEYPPPPQSHHHHHHHHPASINNNNSGSNNSNLNLKNNKALNNSALGINLLSTQSDLKRNKMALSASNIPIFFSSNLNINKTGKEKDRKNSLGSTYSAPHKLLDLNQFNLNKNCSKCSTSSHINQNSNSNLNSISSNLRIEYRVQNDFKSFWECSKPCGILTVCVSVLLALTSMMGFFLLFEENLCQWAHTCSNSLLKICSVICLAMGLVFGFIGGVIVIYTKRDDNTQVIVTKGKRLNKSNLECIEKHQQQIESLLEAEHFKNANNHNHQNHNGNKLNSNIEIKIDLDNSTEETNTNKNINDNN